MNLNRVVEISFALAGKCRHTKRCRHYSFIFENKKLLSIGINSPKTHPLNLKYNYINKQKNNISEVVGTHSELSAVIKLGLDDYSGLILVNTRINRNNKLDYSFPCNGCMDMIRQLNFEKVVYSDKDGRFSELELSSQREFSR